MNTGVPFPVSGTRCGVSDVGAPPIPDRLFGPRPDFTKILRDAGIPEPPGRQECLALVAKEREARSVQEQKDRRQADLRLAALLQRQSKKANHGTNWRK